MTAWENITLPMIFAGANLDEQMEKSKKLLEMVELGHRMNNKPSELSGGQQQRRRHCAQFANDPAIILADEPTGNLDQKTGKLIIRIAETFEQRIGSDDYHRHAR